MIEGDGLLLQLQDGCIQHRHRPLFAPAAAIVIIATATTNSVVSYLDYDGEEDLPSSHQRD